jgi:dethiobiotin synthetase
MFALRDPSAVDARNADELAVTPPAPDGRAGLFFTGTDTGVGKTFVTAAVARLLRQQGRRVAVCKPVATGAERCGIGWLSADTRQLAEAAGIAKGLDGVTPWAFPEPVAPPVAARLHGVTLTLPELVEAVAACRRPDTVLLVEGVGGLLCPLTEQETVADLVRALGLPLIVVARRSLGTLNHTLLTVEVARRRGLAVAGVVVNEIAPPEGLAEATNVAELARLLPVPVLGLVPYQGAAAATNEPVLTAVDWWRLCHATCEKATSQEHPVSCRT